MRTYFTAERVREALGALLFLLIVVRLFLG